MAAIGKIIMRKAIAHRTELPEQDYCLLFSITS
jgi:hypothetical protein